MQQPEPCSDLATCREHVASIEATFDDVPLRVFTLGALKSYESQLVAAIQTVRSASPGLNLQSKQGVIHHLRTALDALGLAITQLEEKGEKGKNQQFNKNLRSCQESLADALSFW